MTEYTVVNENTLCYKQEGWTMLGVLAGKITKGGRDWMNGPFFLSPSDKVRPATLQDFEYFRVCSKGHLN